MKDFPLITTRDTPVIQAIHPGEAVPKLSNSYRLLWLETPYHTSTRRLLIQPPGKPLARQDIFECSGCVVSFAEEFLLMFGFEDSGPFRITAALPATLDISNCLTSRTIERTIASLKRQSHQLPKGSLVLSGLLKILLVSVTRIFEQAGQDRGTCVDQRVFERFIDLIRQRNLSKKGMQDYARALSIRPDVLSETIKRVSGYPASHHIYQHIIRTAKHAAIGSGSTMKEVAFALGFKDVAHFSKFFRNKAGMTFSDYKKAYQVL
ncbi:AraC-type DNA-binding protein [Dyadobacter soli]|uniref:AraC-type DNA-binding protein n=1 Tax=Dyadobacter soli TaxID=659014 RepID=A0A1G7SLP9_9BACT|nr:helix-turn-helix domain-containing protein [Dyadobacter soli]SDG23995.1 AraC-type DNA-binding protein [Dyadobacter soli]